MLDEIKKILVWQLEASLCTLYQCIKNCPNSEWNNKHGDYPFSQVLFHTLFYTDFYISKNEEDFKNQEFHKKNKDIFKDYEELEYKLAVNVYKKEEIEKYFSYCRGKIENIINADNESTLLGPSGFSFQKIPRIELYIDLIRHIQHHAAQLGLRIQQINKTELKWISSGWKEV